MKLHFLLETVGQNFHQIVDQVCEKKSNSSKFQSEDILPVYSLLCESDYNIDTSRDRSESGFTSLAKKRIMTAPYLVDLESCLNWTNLYFWKVGELKTFLKKASQEKEFDDVVFVEYNLNKFIKVSKSLTTEDFLDALENLDCHQSMHALLSVIVASPSVNDAPISLLENYIKTSFLRHCNSHDDTDATEILLNFTLKCFVLLPFPILLNVAIKVFIIIILLLYYFFTNIILF